MRVDPQNASRAAVCAREAAEGAQGDGVIAAEDERLVAVRDRPLHEPGDPLGGHLDLRQEPHALVTHVGGLGDRGFDVSEVDHLAAEFLESSPQPRIADRRWAHVDAAPILPEVERSADHCHRFQLFCHRIKATQPLAADGGLAGVRSIPAAVTSEIQRS